MKKCAAIILFALFLISIFGGCETYDTSYDSYTPESYTRTYTTKVISDPPGARIELDGDYIGDAPLEIQWEGWSLNGLFYRDHTVKALPIYEGQYVQSKFFRGGLMFRGPRDPVPKTILFVMSLATVPRRYEIDID